MKSNLNLDKFVLGRDKIQAKKHLRNKIQVYNSYSEAFFARKKMYRPAEWKWIKIYKVSNEGIMY
jgi:hypothetical protein